MESPAKALFKLHKMLESTVEVRPVSMTEIIEASKNGSLKEVFGAGTAVVISPISGIGYQGEKYTIAEQTNSYAAMIKEKIVNIQYNKSDDPYGWRKEVLPVMV